MKSFSKRGEEGVSVRSGEGTGSRVGEKVGEGGVGGVAVGGEEVNSEGVGGGDGGGLSSPGKISCHHHGAVPPIRSVTMPATMICPIGLFLCLLSALPFESDITHQPSALRRFSNGWLHRCEDVPQGSHKSAQSHPVQAVLDRVVDVRGVREWLNGITLNVCSTVR